MFILIFCLQLILKQTCQSLFWYPVIYAHKQGLYKPEPFEIKNLQLQTQSLTGKQFITKIVN